LLNRCQLYFIRGLYEEALNVLLTALQYFQQGRELTEFKQQTWYWIEDTLLALYSCPYQGNRNIQEAMIKRDIKLVLEIKYLAHLQNWQEVQDLVNKRFDCLRNTWEARDVFTSELLPNL